MFACFEVAEHKSQELHPGQIYLFASLFTFVTLECQISHYDSSDTDFYLRAATRWNPC